MKSSAGLREMNQKSELAWFFCLRFNCKTKPGKSLRRFKTNMMFGGAYAYELQPACP